MATLQWALICERAIIEDGTRNLTLVSVFSNVRLPPLPSGFTLDPKAPPMVPHRFYVVHSWSRSKKDVAEKAVVRSRLLTPDGKRYGESAHEVNLEAFESAQFASLCPGFPFAGPGAYKVQFQVLVGSRWKLLKTISFDVMVDKSMLPTTRSH